MTQQSFERFLNTYFWKSNLYSSAQINDWTLSANTVFQSTLIDLNQRAIRDENQIDLSISKPFHNNINLVFNAANYFLSDNRNLFRNNAISNTAQFGARIQPNAWSNLRVNMGAKAERQVNQFGSGLIYLIDGDVSRFQFSNIEINSRVNWAQERLEPRLNQDRGAILSLIQTYARAQLSLSGGATEDRRDYFTNVLASVTPVTVVERRKEQNFFTIDSLSYKTFSSVLTKAKVELRRRIITRENSQQFSDPSNTVYDNEIEQFKLATDIGVSYSTPTLLMNSGMMFQEQQETYRPINALAENPIALNRERFRDNAFQVATIYFAAEWLRITEPYDTTHRVGISSNIRGFRYNTPDTTNTDDRDEVSYALAISDSFRVNEYSGVRISFSYSTIRNVFISGFRSANNTENRVLKLSPASYWRVPKRLMSYNEFSVLANYTIYDFEVGSQARSFSFRQFSFLDSSQINLSADFSAKLIYEQRIYERSELYWSDFAEKPLSRFNDRLMDIEIQTNTATLLAAIGMRLFARSQTNFQNLRELRQPDLMYIGPTAKLLFHPSQMVSIESNGWYQLERIGNQTTRKIPNFILAVRMQF